MVDIRVDGVDEHHAFDFLAVASGKHTEVECAEIVTNENVRAIGKVRDNTRKGMPG